MPVLDAERSVRRGMIRGRESRNQSLNTKLTETEHEAVLAEAAAVGKTSGEWLRDLVLRSLQSGASDPEVVALSEIVGVRLLLVNVLRSLGTGQKLSTEAFDKLLDDIGSTKSELAVRLVADRRR